QGPGKTPGPHVFSLKPFLVCDSHFSGKKSATKRHTGNDSHVGGAREREKSFSRLLHQKIVFRLDGFRASAANRGGAFFARVDRDAIVADLPFLLVTFQ